MTTGAAEDRVEMLGPIPEGSGQKPRVAGSDAANVTGRKATQWPEAATGLMEKIVSRGNMMAAYSDDCNIYVATRISGERLGLVSLMNQHHRLYTS